MKRTIFLISALAISLITSSAWGQCSGNACGSLNVTFDGCYHFNNTGSKSISASLTPYGGIASSMSDTIGPGQTWSPFYYGDGCLVGYSNLNANFAADNAKQGKEEVKLTPCIRPKDISKPLSAIILWNAKTTPQTGAGKYVASTTRNGDGIKKEDLHKQDDCAGEWASCFAVINDPANQNLMVIRNATETQDAMRRAKECRSDVSSVTCYSSAVLACAPYIACTAP